jgi:sirohydrochlorin ferrochelatase
VQVSFLELAEPGVEAGGALCVGQGATDVILLPHFLSPGVHVVEDLAEVRDRLGERFPGVRFVLAEPLGRHPLLLEILEQRAREVE